ncbi:hypothetical protein AUR04nite_03520 [Glutamicibacter uratoxydans]|uniref:Lipoprotein n=1 Tax=Glutamicibacter uratoxydans TaxID=43667 RepID=A0A4Y4DMI7_GLUUR|nr:carbohydrate-binding domain-containing protein [Glutamicibacter uratoxydans]GED04820.1 hypothetical protein AUR04nite_03520 [Glutamicibacter uratoxydans]
MRSTSRLRAALAAAALVLALSLAGCVSDPAQTVADVTGSNTVQSEALTIESPDHSFVPLGKVKEDTGFVPADLAAASGPETSIALRNDGTTAHGQLADSVRNTGNTVTITRGGTYRISGSLRAGQLRVDAADGTPVKLVFDGLRIESVQGPAVKIQHASKVVLELAEGSSNSLSHSAHAASNQPAVQEAVLSSLANLAITGSGALDVSAEYGEGIRSAQGLLLAGGKVTLRAAGDGLSGQKYVAMLGGNYALTSAANAIHAAGTTAQPTGWFHQYAGQLSISASASGIFAAGKLEISSGSLLISESMQGLHSPAIQISGGHQSIFADKQGIVAQQQLSRTAGAVLKNKDAAPAVPQASATVSGGDMSIFKAATAIDSDGDISLEGGQIVVAAADAAIGQVLRAPGKISINDAVLAVAGPQDEAPVLWPDTGQNTIDAHFDAAPPIGTSVLVLDSASTVIASLPVGRSVNQLHVTSGKLKEGESYQLYAGAPHRPGSTLDLEHAGALIHLGADAAHR